MKRVDQVVVMIFDSGGGWWRFGSGRRPEDGIAMAGRRLLQRPKVAMSSTPLLRHDALGEGRSQERSTTCQVAVQLGHFAARRDDAEVRYASRCQFRRPTESTTAFAGVSREVKSRGRDGGWKGATEIDSDSTA